MRQSVVNTVSPTMTGAHTPSGSTGIAMVIYLGPPKCFAYLITARHLGSRTLTTTNCHMGGTIRARLHH